MSQKVRILKVTIRGAAPFIGVNQDGNPVWSRQPEQVMEWLCDGWRYRFNAYRSRRNKYGPGKALIPIGDKIDERTLAQTRKAESFMAAIPTLVAESPEKVENNEWWSAIKRRETLRQKGVKPGATPEFKRRKDGLSFVCWNNGGRNANFYRTGRKTGIVTVTGQNPATYRQEGGARFSVRIHVRVSEPIREYTSIRVNWTNKTLVFTSPPKPIDRVPTNKTVGIDRGVIHNIATDSGEVYSFDRDRLTKLDKKVRAHQKAMGRAIKVSGHKNEKEYRQAGASKRFLKHANAVRKLHAKTARIAYDAQQKLTTDLVYRFDKIAVEDLNPAMMIRKTAPVPDPLRPGKYLPNGRAAKRGLSRSLASARMGQFLSLLTHKAGLAGVELHEVPAYYTSQRCAVCGVIDERARESQARFVCRNTSCPNTGNTVNADINAAKNISWVAFQNQGRGLSPRVERASDDYARATVATAAPVKREPQQVTTSVAAAGIPRL